MKTLIGKCAAIVRKHPVWFLAACVPFVLYLAFFNRVEPARAGLARNWVTGDYWMQGPGMYLTPPWVWVSEIDLKPIKVSVCSAGHGYSSKLVQFDPEHWKEFVSVEGWRYYWWDNRLSFNLGYEEEFRGFRDTMRGHAYGVEEYSFVKLISEYQR